MTRLEALMTRRNAIVVSVVGLLALGLAFLFFNRVRGDYHRSQSKNNLRQLCVAAENYKAIVGHLPPYVDYGQRSSEKNGRKSAFFQLLNYAGAFPESWIYFEQESEWSYAAPSTTTLSGTFKNTHYRYFGGAANQINPVFISPADTTAPGGLRDVEVTMASGNRGYLATSSYAVNALVFGRDDLSAEAECPDGNSHTLLMTERPQVCQQLSEPPVYNLWGYGTYGPQAAAFAALTPDEPTGFRSTGQISPVLPLPRTQSSEPLPVRIGFVTAVQSPSPTPRPFQVNNGSPCDPRLPRSAHHDVILVAMADLSVREMSPQISAWLFWAMCTPDGNENTLGN